jgi:ATP synthase protein I
MRYTFAALPGAERSNIMLRALRKPIRTVLIWQAAAGVAMTLLAAWLADLHGAVSVAAGAAISVVAGLAAALVASVARARSAGGVLIGALRAEAVKLALALVLVWLVLANYGEVRVGLFLGAFVVTMVIFSFAFFVREY